MQTYTVNPIALTTKFDKECGYLCACRKIPHIKALVEIDERMYWHYFCRKCLGVKLEDEPEFQAAWLATMSILFLVGANDFVDDGNDVSMERLNKMRASHGQPPYKPMQKVEPGVYVSA
jgi:hypothetical protein